MITVTMRTEGQTLTGPSYEMYELFSRAFHEHRRQRPTKPFEVGKQYQRHDGVVVTCIDVRNECARFDDYDPDYIDEHGFAHTRGWRYNRDSDRGRCTASRPDNYRNVIPEYVA